MTNEEFGGFVEQYEKLVFTICYQMVRDYHEAQNLAQDTFFSAFRKIDSCSPENYKPWLARIASNKAKDFLKSAYVRRVTADDGEQLACIPTDLTPDRLYITSETEQYIHDQIRSLHEPYLKVSVLYFIEEKNVDEISQLLERPKKTVQTQLYRAKVMLQELLKEERQR